MLNIWQQAMGPAEPMPTVRVTGPDEYLPTVFPVTTAATATIAEWEGVTLEDALAAAGGCCAVMRTVDEWKVHPQGQALAQLPPIEVERIGDAPPRARTPAARPAAGIRVLDFTRVIAGPLSAR